MSECDNWEKRKKMLEENGWLYDKLLWKSDRLWWKDDIYACEFTLKAMLDNEFLDFTDSKYKPTKQDAINHPSYYTDGKIEVSDFIADKNLNFFRGNVVKYVARAGKKDSSKEVEDLKKAAWYIGREIERVDGKA